METEGHDMTENNVNPERRASEEESSEGSASSRGSITHPYRSLMDDTSFARCNPMATPEGGTETYTRSLMMLGHGTPIWDPVGVINRPEKHVESGIMIGDVGHLTNEGDFTCYFNIFLPPTDPMQRFCPPDLEPLYPPPVPEDIVTNPAFFPPGTTLTSKGVETSKSSSSASPLDIKFTVKARESGILVLPDGASREDLVSTTSIREYVHKHALDWYIFFNKRINLRVTCPNGSLCVVTGSDKASNWAVASSPQGHMSLTESPTTVRYQAGESPVWKSSKGMATKSSGQTEQKMNCAVFVRGMRVAVNVRDWTKYVLQNELPAAIPFSNVLAVPTMGLRAKFQAFKERRLNFPEQDLPQDTRFIFHPMEVVLRYLLAESPNSDVAIAEDSTWCAFCDENDGTLYQVGRILVKILESHEISTDSENEIVSLAPISSQDGSKGNVLARLSSFVKAHRRRREIERKLGNVFPGPAVPPGQDAGF